MPRDGGEDFTWDELSRCVNGVRTALWTAKFEESNTVFIHMPRCAGSSVEASIFNMLHVSQHNTVPYWKSVFGSKFYDAKFKFTFVRDPLDRFISAFDYLLQRVEVPGGPSISRHDTLSGEILRDRYRSDPMSYLEHIATLAAKDRWDEVEVHFRPQVSFLGSEGVGGLDFVGRFERLHADFDELVAKHFPRADSLVHHRSCNTPLGQGAPSGAITPLVSLGGTPAGATTPTAEGQVTALGLSKSTKAELRRSAAFAAPNAAQESSVEHEPSDGVAWNVM